jgi:hypothetical protein
VGRAFSIQWKSYFGGGAAAKPSSLDRLQTAPRARDERIKLGIMQHLRYRDGAA